MESVSLQITKICKKGLKQILRLYLKLHNIIFETCWRHELRWNFAFISILVFLESISAQQNIAALKQNLQNYLNQTKPAEIIQKANFKNSSLLKYQGFAIPSFQRIEIISATSNSSYTLIQLKVSLSNKAYFSWNSTKQWLAINNDIDNLILDFYFENSGLIKKIKSSSPQSLSEISLNYYEIDDKQTPLIEQIQRSIFIGSQSSIAEFINHDAEIRNIHLQWLRDSISVILLNQISNFINNSTKIAAFK